MSKYYASLGNNSKQVFCQNTCNLYIWNQFIQFSYSTTNKNWIKNSNVIALISYLNRMVGSPAPTTDVMFFLKVTHARTSDLCWFSFFLLMRSTQNLPSIVWFVALKLSACHSQPKISIQSSLCGKHSVKCVK